MVIILKSGKFSFIQSKTSLETSFEFVETDPLSILAFFSFLRIFFLIFSKKERRLLSSEFMLKCVSIYSNSIFSKSVLN